MLTECLPTKMDALRALIADCTASAEQLGKNIGDDLAEGAPTLPLLYALWHGSAAQGALLRVHS